MKSEYYARARLFYLIVLSSALFFVDKAGLVTLVAIAQLGLYLVSGLPLGVLFRAVSRLWLLGITILASYLLIPFTADASKQVVQLWGFSLNIYPDGAAVAGVMVLRIVTLITASLWARQASSPEAFIEALQWFRLPQTVAIAIDAGLQLSSQKKGGGKGKGGGRHRQKGGGQGDGAADAVSYSAIREGRMGFMGRLLNKSNDRARDFLERNYPNIKADTLHDTAIIVTVVAAAMSLKLLQLLPGLPIAPGHKNLIVVPLLVTAVLATKSRWGGLQAGVAVGVASFMLGYGKFGLLEVAHFALPGLAADLLAPLLLRQPSRALWLRFALLGAAIGLTRFAANFMIIILAGAPLLAWVVFAPMLVSQILFGALSAPIGIYVVDKITHGNLFAGSKPVESVEPYKKEAK